MKNIFFRSKITNFEKIFFQKVAPLYLCKVEKKKPPEEKKSKNQPNFWSFWSYTFIFGEDRAYFMKK